MVGAASYGGGWNAGSAGAAEGEAMGARQMQDVAPGMQVEQTMLPADERPMHALDALVGDAQGSMTDTARVTGAADFPVQSVAA